MCDMLLFMVQLICGLHPKCVPAASGKNASLKKLLVVQQTGLSKKKFHFLSEGRGDDFWDIVPF